MSQDAVRRQMDEAWNKAREELLAVMKGAPQDSIISGTEWQVREIQQRLARECFQIMVQNKVDQMRQGAFSPGEPPASSAAGPAADRGPRPPVHHDQRRDPDHP